MNENKEVMTCLRQLSEQMSEQFSVVQSQLNCLDAKIDNVEKSLNGKIDKVEKSLNGKIDKIEKSLDAKIDNVEKSLNGKIDNVEKSLDAKIDNVEKNLDAKIKSLDVKIDNVEKSLDVKIDNVEKSLNGKIDSFGKSLNEKIDMVYYIACENRENIQEMRREIDELLIPYNDRNLSVNEQISKISELEAWKEEAEKVIGNHSEAIHKLQEAIA